MFYKSKRFKIFTYFLIFFLLLSPMGGSYAADEVDIIDLELAKELALKHSRDMKGMDLAVEKAKYSEYEAKDDYTDARYSGYYTFLNEYFYLNDRLAEGDTSVEARIAVLEKEISKAKETMNADTINLANLKDKYDEAEALYDDKVRAKADFEKQLEYQMEQLYVNILNSEAQLKLLEKTYDLKVITLNYERMKKELGTFSGDIDKMAVEASDISKSIKYLKDKLKVQKWEFNELLGREREKPLQLVDYHVNLSLAVPNYMMKF